MDVLAYSAFNESKKLDTSIASKTTELATKTAEAEALLASGANFNAEAICWLNCVEPCLQGCPHATDYWCFIPELAGSTPEKSLKVCDTGTQFNCGKCCSWTVPADASLIRFQLWGAGGGSGPGCCCGGSPFGATGAYASVIIPATAGCSYTICTGCAYCCFPSVGGNGRKPGCPTYVDGYGLNNVCATGGAGTMGQWMGAYGKANTYRLSHWSHPDAGPCFCNSGHDYCFTSSCATCGEIDHVPQSEYFGTVTHPQASGSIVYGLRGMWPKICFNTDHYGYQCHAPIYGFESSSRCKVEFTSGNCCGCECSAERGYLQIPSAGGFYTHAMGGGTSLCGDMGRMGMVCIQWK